MNRRTTVLATSFAAALVVAVAWMATSVAQDAGARPRKVQKTDAQWAKLLTREQYLVTRHKATEPAFSSKLAANHSRGTFKCVCCGAELFSSKTKFDSGTGWPSFYQPIDPKVIENAADFELGYRRVEVMCTDCGAHLGHVFDDGPPPTGLRYCINGAALKFVAGTGTPTAATKKGSSPNGKAGAKGKPAPETPAGEAQPKADDAPAEKDKNKSAGGKA